MICPALFALNGKFKPADSSFKRIVSNTFNMHYKSALITWLNTVNISPAAEANRSYLLQYIRLIVPTEEQHKLSGKNLHPATCCTSVVKKKMDIHTVFLSVELDTGTPAYEKNNSFLWIMCLPQRTWWHLVSLQPIYALKLKENCANWRRQQILQAEKN